MTDAPPKITLAGEEWDIPILAPKQNRIIVPAFLKLADPVNRYAALLDIVFTALTRARSDLKREEFEEMPILTSELIAALPVIQQQAGIPMAQRVATTGAASG